MNIFNRCPVIENDEFLVRLCELNDKQDLLGVYSDTKAVPFFNSDNCHGDDFHYTTLEKMEQALNFWIEAYEKGWFARLSVVSKLSGKVVGTIELCKRENEDFCILRLDLSSGSEKENVVFCILSLVMPEIYALTGCKRVVTKAVPQAAERIKALRGCGFLKSEEKLIGEDGTLYGDYFTINL